MPRDSNGVYALPPGYLAVTGQTILASQHNPPLEDIGSALTGSLPRNGSAPMLGDLNMAGRKIIGAADAVADADVPPKSQVDAIVAAAIAALTPQIPFFALPAGTVALYAGFVVPLGWLEMNGAAVSRTTYSRLFTAIGTLYGVGNGSTTFNLPDARGEFPRFWQNGNGVDPFRVLGSKQAGAVQFHTHGVTDPGHIHGVPGGSANTSSSGSPGVPVAQTTNVNSSVNVTGITIQGTGGNETRPRNIAFYGIIKV